MAVDKKIFIIAALMTAVLFMSIYSFNLFLNKEREEAVLERMDTVLETYEEMQAINMLAEIFGDEMTCIALENRLMYLDEQIWKLGQKIDTYRSLTEEYMEDPFYYQQKKKFNLGEIMYFSMLKQMKEKCNVTSTIILYFYQKAEKCSDCDAQSFVLTDLNKAIDQEISIFSFDADIDLAPIPLLISYYDVTSYPCIVIEDETYCGLHDKGDLSYLLCQQNSHLSICQ